MSLKPAHAGFRDSVLIFSYFTGNGEDGLHLAFSRDGYQFQALNQGKALLKPQVGNDKLMRDPCIIRGGDGRFHLVWTVSWNERGIGYAHSADLLEWSEQRYLPVMEHEPSARNCWAPEVTYDSLEDRYMIYWASTIPGRFLETKDRGDEGYDHRMYYTTTSDFEHFTPTALLYDPGFNVIDASIKQVGSRYVMWLKNETRHPPEKNIRLAFGNTLSGPYGPAGPPIAGIGYWAEGPTAIWLGDQWIVYFDRYMEGKMGAAVSKDLKTWSDVSHRIRFPEGTRHGSVIRISSEEFEKLNTLLPHN